MPKQKTKVCLGCLTELPLANFNKYESGIQGVRANDAGLTPNDLVAIGNVGTVVVTTT
jgi:hypothetical protein